MDFYRFCSTFEVSKSTVMNDRKILIIDDNDAVRKSLKIVLSCHYSQVVALKDPKLIPSLIAAGDVDCIVLDMNFSPSIDGEEGLFWLQRIKYESGLSLPPAVVLITAFGEVDLAVQSLKYGADDFVQKPWDNDRLLSAIEEAINNRKPAIALEPMVASPTQENKEGKENNNNVDSSSMTLDEMEKRHIENVIRESDGNLSIVCRKLGISRQTLYNKLKKYGI